MHAHMQSRWPDGRGRHLSGRDGEEEEGSASASDSLALFLSFFLVLADHIFGVGVVAPN